MKKFNIFQRMKSTSKKRGQSMVEFALALPILLLLLFGLIEFGRLLQAWLALENGARFGMRFAVTGSFDPQYCDEAATALSGVMTVASILGDDYSTTDLIDFNAADISGSGVYDCRVSAAYVQTLDGHTPAKEQEEVELLSNVLIDWARLPSIRDVALQGAMGLAYDPNEPVTGDYPAYLDNSYAVSIFDQAHRGNPSEPGYFSITTCSNRILPNDEGWFLFDPNPQYYNNLTTQDEYRYSDPCRQDDASGIVRFVDDAGGPGDRVRVVLTFRHPLITPLLDTWWPTLRLTSQREGIVEKFRTSRVTGLVGAINVAAMNTLTPSITPTPTNSLTPTPSNTPTPSLTPTPTPTPYPCEGGGRILMQKWNNISGNNVSDLTDATAVFPNNPDQTYYKTSFDSGSGIGNNYGTRFMGWVCPPQDGDYTFYIASDDSSELYLGTTGDILSKTRIAYVNGWTDYLEWDEKTSQKSNVKTLNGGQWYWIETLQKEGTGGDHVSVGWTGPYIGDTIQVIEGQYLKEATPLPRWTSTPVPESCEYNGRGLRGNYYIDDTPGDWLNLRHTRLDSRVNFDWGQNSPDPLIRDDRFQVQWLGGVMPRYRGTYTFSVRVDDGVRLYVNNELIIDKWQNGNTTYYSTTMDLECQEYPIRMEYYENTGGAVAKLYWQSQYFDRQIIPAINLYPAEIPSRPTVTSTPTPLPPTATPITPSPTPRTPTPITPTPVTPTVPTPIPTLITPVSPTPVTPEPTIVRTVIGG